MQVPTGSAHRQCIECIEKERFFFSAHQVQRCSQKSWVFSTFLKIERDSVNRMEFGNLFHHWKTTEEKSLASDLGPCCGGGTRRLSLAECQGFEFDAGSNWDPVEEYEQWGEVLFQAG